MKLVGRCQVEGTEPRMYIGHRERRDPKTGEKRACRPWYVEYSLHGTKQHEKLGTTNKQVAIRKAHEICRRILNGEQAKPTPLALQRGVELYLAAARHQGRAPTTMTKYKYVLERKFLPYAASQGVRWASAFGERHFWGFFDTLSELAEKTRYTEATVAKQLFRWLHREGLISANPITRCRLREPEPTERHCFTPEQVNAMLDRANPVLHPKLIVLAYTGLRFGELRDLRWTDIDLSSGTNGVLHIRRGGSTDSTKTRRSRRIPMHPVVRRAIDSMPPVDGSDRVFHEEPTPTHPELDAPLRERRLLNQIKRLARDCGFPDWESACIHSFRHYFASSLARHGVAEYTALSLMGQRSSDVLHRYLHPHDEDQERAIARLNRG